MANRELNTDPLPATHRAGFEQFAKALLELAGDNLLGLSAFGGWLVNDPFFEGTPARSVAVLRGVDLKTLDRLASSGAKFGKQNLRAPLIMTPEYIKASCDVFPLELLEIQQLHSLVCGEDHFAELTFERKDVRLQCEREFKGELIQLRQGLLAAAGRHRLLGELCLAVTERTLRILRGVLHHADPSAMAKQARDVVTKAATTTNVKLATLEGLVTGGQEPGLLEFEGLYAEVEALAAYADALPGAAPTGQQ
ncbi:MAG: hypothetical protein ACE5I3_10350 [Phycisphaerae bacterium]